MKPILVSMVLDRSGSMSSMRDDTIGGVNTTVKDVRTNKAVPTHFMLTQFDSEGIDTVYDGIDVDQLPENVLTQDNFVPRGSTPLYDAVGKAIGATEKKAQELGADVIMVVVTDGGENCSREWTLDTVRQAIADHERDHQWVFSYIGLGAAAWNATASMSQGTLSATNVRRSFATPQSAVASFQALSNSVSTYTMSETPAERTGFQNDFYQGQTDDVDKEEEAEVTS